jgi:hypothetical protein
MLALALKNRDSIVIASDVDDPNSTDNYSEFNLIPNNKVIAITGNIEAIKHPVQVAFSKFDPSLSAAAVAELIQASLIVETVPNLAELKGRVELIVAGFNKLRHVMEPDIYYMDSAQDFFLKPAMSDAVGAGATAALTSLFAGHSFADSTASQLSVLVKESYSATKLRWPSMVKNHIKLGVLTESGISVQAY